METRQISEHIVAWIRCFGIPLHLWICQSFSLLVSETGKLLNVDEDTSSFNRVEFARLRVRTTNLEPIFLSKLVKLNEEYFAIRLV